MIITLTSMIVLLIDIIPYFEGSIFKHLVYRRYYVTILKQYVTNGAKHKIVVNVNIRAITLYQAAYRTDVYLERTGQIQK